MLYFWGILSDVGKGYPRSKEIGEHIAMGSGNALALLRSIQNDVKVPAIFEVLIDSTHDFPDSAIIKKQFIRGITILLPWGLDSTEGQSLDSWQKVCHIAVLSEFIDGVLVLAGDVSEFIVQIIEIVFGGNAPT